MNLLMINDDVIKANDELLYKKMSHDFNRLTIPFDAISLLC